jgi:hypothetical protein
MKRCFHTWPTAAACDFASAEAALRSPVGPLRWRPLAVLWCWAIGQVTGVERRTPLGQVELME